MCNYLTILKIKTEKNSILEFIKPKAIQLAFVSSVFFNIKKVFDINNSTVILIIINKNSKLFNINTKKNNKRKKINQKIRWNNKNTNQL